MHIYIYFMKSSIVVLTLWVCMTHRERGQILLIAFASTSSLFFIHVSIYFSNMNEV